VEVNEGETATLTCEVNKPDVKAIWSKQGEMILPNEKYTITVVNTVHTLTIKDCDFEDDAEYTITIDDHTSMGNVFVIGTLRCCLSRGSCPFPITAKDKWLCCSLGILHELNGK